MRLAAHRLAVRLPAGWDGRIYRRPGGYAILHAANFPLPAGDGDFAVGATAAMPADGVLVVLAEYEPALAGSALFAAAGTPTALAPPDVSTAALMRRVPGRGGVQRFFSSAGRAFCLYVVVGSLPDAASLLPHANAVLASTAIAPG